MRPRVAASCTDFWCEREVAMEDVDKQQSDHTSLAEEEELLARVVWWTSRMSVDGAELAAEEYNVYRATVSARDPIKYAVVYASELWHCGVPKYEGSPVGMSYWDWATVSEALVALEAITRAEKAYINSLRADRDAVAGELDALRKAAGDRGYRLVREDSEEGEG